MWRITIEVLEELGESGILMLGENLTYTQIYGPDGKLGHFFSWTWETADSMRTDLMQNHGGGVPMSVIDKLVNASEVAD
jgi:hypothetical protein